MPEEPVTEHKPIVRRLVLTEAQKRSMHAPEGAKQHAKREREWAADWAAEEGFGPGVAVDRGGGDQGQQERHGPQQAPPDVYPMEVRGGAVHLCSARLHAQTLGLPGQGVSAAQRRSLLPACP